MAIVNVTYIFTVGAVIVAAQHNTNFSVIYQDYSGNIQDVNIASNAAIGYAKLSLNASIKNTDLAVGVGTSANNIVALNSAGFLTVPYAYIKCSNTQSQNTGGGSTTSGSWNTAIINTKDIDTGSIATLTSNAISLPVGTYQVRASMPLYNGGSGTFNQIRLYNNTASAVLINGQSLSSDTGVQVITNLFGIFIIGVTSSIIIQYQISHSSATGQGIACNFGTEVYAIIELIKIG